MSKRNNFTNGKTLLDVNQAEIYKNLFNNYPDSLFVINLSEEFIDVNIGLETLTGYSKKELLGTPFANYIFEEDLNDVKGYFYEALLGTTLEKEFRIVHKSGEIRYVGITGVAAKIEDEVIGVYGLAKDITEKKLLQSVVKNNELRFESLIQNSTDVIAILESDGTIRYQSSSVKQVLGYEPSNMEGTSVFKYILNEDIETASSTLSKVLQNPGSTSKAEVRVVKSDGTFIYCDAHATNLLEDENVNGIVVNYRDITERKKHEQDIQYIAYHDFLTGLPNRYMLEKQLEDLITSSIKRSEKIAVLFIDLDRFKVINDSLGHTVGDLLLKEVAVRLKTAIRKDDILFRTGGDEFIIILSNVDREIATTISERIIQALATNFTINQFDVYTSPSIGISVFPDDGTTVEQLIKHADFAMYQAKKNSSNTFAFFSSSVNDNKINPLKMEIDLHKALERNEFLLHYQPKVSLKTGNIIGLEALIRWNHPEFGMVSPGTFIPIAEESGLIIPIGEWALHEACYQNKKWHEQGFKSAVSVNLSPRQFTQTNLTDTIAKVLEKTGLEPHLLEVEITESMTADIARTTVTLQELKKLGIKISIDDFGIGFSSLNYLKLFPVDTLKIDQSFVSELSNNPHDETIVKTIIAMAHNLNLNVVAEGIETREQLVFLQQHLCNDGQGYFFSKPLSPKELEENMKDIQNSVKNNGISQDLKERIWAEELVLLARKELQETLRLQQGMTVKFKKIDGRFIHTLCDGALLYKLGFIPHQIIGKELKDFLPLSDAQSKEIYYERAWNREDNVSFEAELNGIYYLAMLRPIFRGGEVVEVIVSCTDITERKKVEEALRTSERNYRLIAENMTDLIGLMDIKGEILYASPSHETILGYESARFLGKSALELIHPEDIPALYEKCEQMVEAFSPFQLEFRYRHRNGNWVLIETYGTPIKEENGDIRQFVFVGRDITAKRQEEESVKRSEKLAVVGELAAGIAHEIRNPITSIKGFIQLLEQGKVINNYFDVIHREFDQIEEILKEFLFLANPKDVDLKRVSVMSVVNDVIKHIKTEEEVRNKKISFELVDINFEVLCDPLQIKQVLLNLIKNSIDAIQTTGFVKIQVYKKANDIILDVIDNGIGISEERLQKLGEPFFSNKEKGTGLGLMLANQIIKEHNGTIIIKSEKNVGTCVSVMLPFRGV